MCCRAWDQRMLQRISCWNLHPALVLVQTPFWSLYHLVIKPFMRRHEEGPDLIRVWFSAACARSEPADFIQRIASDPKISVPHEEPKAHFRYTALDVSVTDCSADACRPVMTPVDRARSSLITPLIYQVDMTVFVSEY